MWSDCLQLLFGLALIVKGGEWFVAAAVRLAEFLRLPRVVIGSTLVSLATTSPELVVSVMSGLRGESGLALGNAVGSCICNIGLILGITAAIRHVDVHPRALRTPLWAMFLFGAALFLMTLDLTLSRGQGVVLLLAGIGYFVWDFWQHWRDREPADEAEATIIELDVTVGRTMVFNTLAGTAAQFMVGALVVIVGSRFLVNGAVNVAGGFGVPAVIIGLTVVALGTSLPELITAITSSRQAVSDLAVGNVLGANIANLSLIVGTAAAIHEITLDRWTQVFNFPALLVMMGLLLWMLLTDRRVTRREGVILLATYAVYLAGLVAFTLRLTP